MKRRQPVRPPPAHKARPAYARPRNRLLAALPAEVFRRMLPHLKTIPVRRKQVVYRVGEPLGVVVFPNGGVFSITTVLPDGTMVEAATVGNEGMLCIEAFFSDDPKALGQTLLQVPDTDAVTMSVDAFREELSQRGALHTLIGRYSSTVVAQMMQSTACNALHPVQQRCARWLLMTHDRMQQQDFHLSHEFLALMLGVQRPTVTVVAGGLQTAGLISYKHGQMKVLDREGLESASCPCYGVIRAQFDRLF
jgi:CRP-like cAMP-binding protein